MASLSPKSRPWSSMSGPRLAKLALDEIGSALRLIWILFVLGVLEGYSRVLGWWDYRVHKRTHVVWDMAWTTKDPGQAIQDRADPALPASPVPPAPRRSPLGDGGPPPGGSAEGREESPSETPDPHS